MKTLFTTPSNSVIKHRCVKFILAILGIVTAALCTIAFVEDTQTAEAFNENSLRLTETPIIRVVDFVSKVMTWL
jgi:hypothetical protein